MTSNCKFIALFIISAIFYGCGNYSFTGASIPEGTETFQVNFFENQAGNSMGSIFEPGLDRDFTIALQDILQNQTNLQLVNSDGDLLYEGEITEYRISPTTATSGNTAAQNRLSISVNVRFFNIKDPEQDLEQRFSFFYDYAGSDQLIGAQKDVAHQAIFERLTQDIFNATLAKW